MVEKGRDILFFQRFLDNNLCKNHLAIKARKSASGWTRAHVISRPEAPYFYSKFRVSPPQQPDQVTARNRDHPITSAKTRILQLRSRQIDHHEAQAHEVHPREMHIYDVHAHEMQAHEVHAHEVHARRYMPMRHTPVRYTPIRRTPVTYTPMRCMPVTCTPMRCTL
jgi:hypothetical protein